MFVERATVISFQQGIAEVECISQQGCGGCAAKSSCGAAALGELNGERGALRFKVKSEYPLQAGQQVEIGLSESSVLLSAILLYSLPLFALLASTIIGGQWIHNELWLTALIIGVTGATFLFVKRIATRLNHNKKYQPVLLQRII